MHSAPKTPIHDETDARAELDSAICRAQELVDRRPRGGYHAGWLQTSAHYGDVTILALALRQ